MMLLQYTAVGATDFLVLKLDSAGTILQALTWGGTASDNGGPIQVRDTNTDPTTTSIEDISTYLTVVT